MGRTTDPVLELKGSLARSKALRSRPHAAHVFSAWRARRRGGQFREGMKQARRPSHGNGGTRCPDALFSASSREPAGRGCVSLPRHETAWFGCERRAWRESEGIGAPGADDRSVRVRSAFSTCVSPLRRRCALAPRPLAPWLYPAIVIGTTWQVDPLRIPPLPRSASHQNPAWRLERERPSNLP
jgi:hypothetical protein